MGMLYYKCHLSVPEGGLTVNIELHFFIHFFKLPDSNSRKKLRKHVMKKLMREAKDMKKAKIVSVRVLSPKERDDTKAPCVSLLGGPTVAETINTQKQTQNKNKSIVQKSDTMGSTLCEWQVVKETPSEQPILEIIEQESMQKSVQQEGSKSESLLMIGIDENCVYEKDGIKFRLNKSSKVPQYCCIKCPVQFQTWQTFKLHSEMCKKILPTRTGKFVEKTKQENLDVMKTNKKQLIQQYHENYKLKRHKRNLEEASDPERVHEKDGLYYHRKMEMDFPYYHCLQCEHKCRTWEAFQRHCVKQHKANVELKEPKRYSCSECGKTYGRKSALDIHINAVHSQQNSYTCEYCGHFTRYHCALLSHIKRVHTEDFEPHRCTFPGCSKVFGSKGNLERHLTVHTGERKFKCNECGKSFKSPSNLYQHSLTHKPEGKYKCSRCHRTFNYNQSYKIHVSKCTGAATNEMVGEWSHL